MTTTPQLRHVPYKEWTPSLEQGEHVAIIGPTGTGKTTIAAELLDQREYVCVLAVKRHDDTLEIFTNKHYTTIANWPPLYGRKRVVYWPKPSSIQDGTSQSDKLYVALNAMYLSGGWCIYFDEAGYVAGYLGLGQALGILLNQGRSSSISVVATMTRPSSVIAKVPKEALNQPRHKLIFKYDNEDEIKTCARIADIPVATMREYMQQLRYHLGYRNNRYSDFLYLNQGDIVLIENSKEQH
jgi:energy-coupling factor transporter ATP-binding protein EcfA2